jgi:hypothetical protein
MAALSRLITVDSFMTHTFRPLPDKVYVSNKTMIVIR